MDTTPLFASSPFPSHTASEQVDRLLTTAEGRQTLLTLACDMAEHVLPVFEAAYPDDPRVRDTIAAVRRGDITPPPLPTDWPISAAFPIECSPEGAFGAALPARQASRGPDGIWRGHAGWAAMAASAAMDLAQTIARDPLTICAPSRRAVYAAAEAAANAAPTTARPHGQEWLWQHERLAGLVAGHPGHAYCD